MGNKLGRKRQVVDEKYTRPQGLYQHKDVDQKKLKKLILDSKLAPCYPGDDDCACDLEECPICFLYYPSLNRSRCCMKGICTECFLQMKTPNSTRPTQCPFCKTSNYAVEYRGVKTKEEKGLEQIEEQRVIEAKIRMRQKELQDDEERMLKRTETSASTSMRRASEVDYRSITAPSIASTVESEEIVATHVPNAASALRLPPRQRQNREEDFDLDLEDIMVMEAIWLSIQESDRAHDPPYNDAAASAQSEEHIAAATTQVVAGPSMSSSSPSSGFACAIAALAESQQIMTGSNETTNNYHGEISAYNNMPSSSSRYSNRDEPETFFPQESSAMMVTSSSLPDDGQQFVMNGGGQWVIDHRSSEAAEAGNTYSYGEGSTDDFDNNGLRIAGEQDVTSQSDFQPAALGGPTIVPESFEEQMMLAMAVSLAEARVARRNTSPPGLAWH